MRRKNLLCHISICGTLMGRHKIKPSTKYLIIDNAQPWVTYSTNVQMKRQGKCFTIYDKTHTDAERYDAMFLMESERNRALWIVAAWQNAWFGPSLLITNWKKRDWN